MSIYYELTTSRGMDDGRIETLGEKVKRISRNKFIFFSWKLTLMFDNLCKQRKRWFTHKKKKKKERNTIKPTLRCKPRFKRQLAINQKIHN